LLVNLILGLFKTVAVGLLVYLTYFFTTTFANRTPPPAPLSEQQVKLAKQAEDLRNQGKTLLSSYGWVNPATKSTVRIPIERAMELMVAEAARPPAPVAAPAPGRGPDVGGPIKIAAGGIPAGPISPPVAPPAPAGMRPEQLYHAVCLTCHGPDGSGKMYRLLVPSIPDLTDAKWQDSRPDSELQHTILEGKETIVAGKKVDPQPMVSQKVNLERAQIDVKDMVAFMRGFKDGKQQVSVDGVLVRAGKVIAPGGPPPTTPNPVAPTNTGGTQLAGPVTPPKPGSSSTSSTNVVIAPTPAPVPSPSPGRGGVLPSPLPVTTGNTAAQAEKIRAAAGATFNTLCIACHGPDGRGMAAARALAPLLPDFTSHDWHTTRSNSQLATTIMEGKALMPAWNTQLTADRARDLALYVRSFGAPELMAETAPASAPSTVEFDNQMHALRQKFDDIEKQLQALATASPRP
jgi:mono/diheme cytochrome c family protein